MESDICRLIFVHSVESLGQSDQWRAEDKVVHFPLSTKSSDISYFPSSHVRRIDCSDSLRPGLSPFLVQISRFFLQRCSELLMVLLVDCGPNCLQVINKLLLIFLSPIPALCRSAILSPMSLDSSFVLPMVETLECD